jgi:hypothetical protein
VEKTYSHLSFEEFLTKPEARMVSCRLSYSTMLKFTDGEYTVEEVGQRLAVRYASHPEAYLNQVMPSGATVEWNSKSYERHGDCFRTGQRWTDDETLYLRYL